VVRCDSHIPPVPQRLPESRHAERPADLSNSFAVQRPPREGGAPIGHKVASVKVYRSVTAHRASSFCSRLRLRRTFALSLPNRLSRRIEAENGPAAPPDRFRERTKRNHLMLLVRVSAKLPGPEFRATGVGAAIIPTGTDEKHNYRDTLRPKCDQRHLNQTPSINLATSWQSLSPRPDRFTTTI